MTLPKEISDALDVIDEVSRVYVCIKYGRQTKQSESALKQMNRIGSYLIRTYAQF